MDHARRIEHAFTTQAEAFEDRSRNQVFTSDARWVFERLPLTAGDVVLDVAADGELWFGQTFASAIASKPS